MLRIKIVLLLLALGHFCYSEYSLANYSGWHYGQRCRDYTITDSYGGTYTGTSCWTEVYWVGGGGGTGSGGGYSGSSPHAGAIIPVVSDVDTNADGKIDCWKSIAQGNHHLDSSDDFGSRVHPITGTVSFHNGIDIQGTRGTTVRSGTGGVVTQVVSSSSSTSGNGAFVRVRYNISGSLYEAVYLHLVNNSVNLQRGMLVVPGSMIGQLNSTGGSTGDHLHFTVYEVNPTTGMKTAIDPVTHLGGGSCQP